MSIAVRILVTWLVFAPVAPAEEPATVPSPPAEEAAEPALAPAVRPQVSGRPTMDHLELDPTAITGNRELPKVMVIVPWKKAAMGELTGKPANSLLNEVLEPIDREVFRRELAYFEALQAKPET